MKKTTHTHFVFHSITEMNKALGMQEPTHPLITINNFNEITADTSEISKGVVMHFYRIAYSEQSSGLVKYGQGKYNSSNGGLSFFSPSQLVAKHDNNNECPSTTLLIHPDFFNGYPLAASIKNYGFFSYHSDEALKLTEKEKEMILGVFKNIREELHQRLDHFSQDVIISQIELLLNYCNRFYNRQFITQRSVNHNLLSRLEIIVEDYFRQKEGLGKGLPTVQYIAGKLNVSPGYLSDVLRSFTGLNTQQFLHQKLIEKAKDYLSSDTLTVAEIAYALGFEHPQSFNKLFKNKMNISPLEFRQSFS